MTKKRTVSDMMVPQVVTLEGTSTVTQACKLMAQANVGAVVIIDAIHEPVGIFTERDVLKRVVASDLDPSKTTLSRVMTPKFVCVQMTDELEGLAELMLENHFRHLPVVEGRKLKGILSIRDIVKFLVSS